MTHSFDDGLEQNAAGDLLQQRFGLNPLSPIIFFFVVAIIRRLYQREERVKRQSGWGRRENPLQMLNSNERTNTMEKCSLFQFSFFIHFNVLPSPLLHPFHTVFHRIFR